MVDIAGHGSFVGDPRSSPSKKNPARVFSRRRNEKLRQDAAIGSVNSSLGSKKPWRRACQLPFLPSYLQATSGLGG